MALAAHAGRCRTGAGTAPWVFLRGPLVNLTNPKAIVFVGALVPRFVDFGRSPVEQYLMIAVTLSLTDIVVISVYASAARRLGRWLHDPQAIRLQNKAFGGLFVSAGTLPAFSSHSP
jgi:homoserine/homoserine lactone efflux protein